MTQTPEKLMTVSEIAKHLRVDDTTVRRWIKSGTLQAIALPHRGTRQAYRVRSSTLENLISPPAIVEVEHTHSYHKEHQYVS